MEYSFGNSRWLTREEIASQEDLKRDFALGLHVPGRFDKILDLHECYLQDEFSIALVGRLRALALEQGWEPYDTIHNTGYLRNLVVRTGQNTDQVMVVVVTTSHQPDRMALMVELIQEAIPSVTTVVNSINSGRSPVAAGEEIVCLGKGFIHERILDRLFQVTPTVFFQPNTLQAERLMGTILDYSAATESRGLLFDLFCGLGTIGLILADHFDRVFGIESHSESIRLAQINSELNQVQNAHFVQGDAAQALQPDSLRQTGVPDVLVLDPPRAGLHQDVVSGVLECRPRRVVYTSCNPATLARDLKLLGESYEVEAVQPVDMFPQTYHIECVAALGLRNRQ
jgi:23S rRNA (uracil1939-C5)-methyltransferase